MKNFERRKLWWSEKKFLTSSYNGGCNLDLYEKKSITDYVHNSDDPLYLKDIQHYLLIERHIEAKKIDISSFIKNKLHLSYERCSSHSSQKDIARLKAQDLCNGVLKYFNNIKVLVSID